MTTALRPMTIGEVLDRAFNLYRNNFVLFAGIAILPPALNLVISVTEAVNGQLATSMAAAVAVGLTYILLFLAYLVGIILASAATTHAVSMVHLGKSTTIGNSYRGIQPYFGRLIGLMVLIFLLMLAISLPVIVFAVLSVLTSNPLFGLLAGFAGLVALVLVVHFYARYSLAMASCVLEKVSAIAAMRRSMYLTKGASGRIWLIFILTAIIGFALVFALEIPFVVLFTSKTITLLTFRLLIAAIGFIAGTVIGPVASISLVLVYYDQRVRKEAFDLQVMMDALGESSPQQAISAAPLG
jgi:hypothetical protein